MHVAGVDHRVTLACVLSLDDPVVERAEPYFGTQRRAGGDVQVRTRYLLGGGSGDGLRNLIPRIRDNTDVHGHPHEDDGPHTSSLRL